MTKAEEFLSLWNRPDRSITAMTLSKRVDPYSVKMVQYIFSDSSAVHSYGRGKWENTWPRSKDDADQA